MEKKIISLDCDGVVADIGKFLKQTFYNHMNREISPRTIEALHTNRLKEYSLEENIDYEKISSFFANSEKELFGNLSNLSPVEGAVEGIRELGEKGIDLVINSYRPSKFKDLKQDTKGITKEWFKKNDIYIPFNLAENKEEKYALICNEGIVTHVDDQVKIIKAVKPLNKTPGFSFVLFKQFYEIVPEDIANSLIVAESWKELPKILSDLYFKD